MNHDYKSTKIALFLVLGFFILSLQAQDGVWISHTPPVPQGGTWYSDAGGNCVGTVPVSSQHLFFFDINISTWTEVSLDTVHTFSALEACGNTIFAYSSNILVGYSSNTSSWDTISYSGTPLSPTQIGVYRSWGCSDNLAYFVTDTEYFIFDSELGTWQSLNITMPPSFSGTGFFWTEEDYAGVVLYQSAPLHSKNLMYSLPMHAFNQIEEGGNYNHSNSGMTHGFVMVYTSGTDNSLYGYSALDNSISDITINGHYIYGSNDRGSADKFTENTTAAFGYNVVNSPTSRTSFMKCYDTRTGVWTEESLTYDPTNWYGITNWLNGGELSVASNTEYGTNYTRFFVYDGLDGTITVLDSCLFGSFSQGYVVGGSVFTGANDSSIYFYSVEGDTGYTVPVSLQSPVWYPGNNFSMFGNYNTSVSDTMEVYLFNGTTDNLNHFNTLRTNQIFSTPYLMAYSTIGTNPIAYFYSGILDELKSYSFPAGSNPGFYYNEKLLCIQATDITYIYHAETGAEFNVNYSMGGTLGKSAALFYHGSHDMEAYSAETGNWSVYNVAEHILGCTTEDKVGLAHCRDGATWTDRYYAYNGYNDNIFYLNPVSPSVLYSDKVGDQTILIVRDSTMYAFDPFGVSAVDDEDIVTLPEQYILKQNYPNPFNPTTNIQFTIPKTGLVTLKVFNLLGQEVTTIVSKKLTPGNYTYTWDASNFASGVYIYKLTTENGFEQSKKLMLLK